MFDDHRIRIRGRHGRATKQDRERSIAVRRRGPSEEGHHHAGDATLRDAVANEAVEPRATIRRYLQIERVGETIEEDQPRRADLVRIWSIDRDEVFATEQILE